MERVEEYNHPELWFKVAACMAESGQLESALNTYQKILSVEEDREEAVLAMANIYNQRNQPDLASDIIDRYVQRDSAGENGPVTYNSKKDLLVVIQKAFNHFSRGDYATFLSLSLPIANDKNLRVGIWRRARMGMDKVNKRLKDKGYSFDKPAPGQHSIIELLGVERYFQFLAKLGVTLIWLSRFDEAVAILEEHRTYMNRLEEYSFDEVQIKTLKWLTSQALIKNSRYWDAMKLVRQMCSSNPNSAPIWNLYQLLAIRTRDRVSNPRWHHRLIAMYPTSLPVLLASAFHYHISGYHKVAIQKYLEAYKLNRKHPMVLLCLGVCYINQSMSRTTSDRHSVVANGFAFLHAYYMATKQSTEATYNLARGFHQLGLYYLAIPLYEKVLRTDDDIKMEAAYNLSLIYRASGSHELARAILTEHVVI
eukprot:TRINITY_DN12910_c0_g1_i1.p1 TRINITY_DN12910_c0_g1~~TRINITY_DN12910_c0_g1_i1.p1  ORF type:complete len:487 (-),score=78.05 TRINITY_DN12910_c0_g1_i1:46-1314(-)